MFLFRARDPDADAHFTLFALQIAGLLMPPIQVYCLARVCGATRIFGAKCTYKNLDVAFPLQLRLAERTIPSMGVEPHLFSTGELSSHLEKTLPASSWSCHSIIEEVCDEATSQAIGIEKVYGKASDMPPPPPPPKAKYPAEDIADQVVRMFVQSTGKSKEPQGKPLIEESDESSDEEPGLQLEDWLIRKLEIAEERASKGKMPFKKKGVLESSDDEPPLPPVSPVDLVPDEPPPAPPPPGPLPPAGDDASAASGGSDGSSRAPKKLRTDFDGLKKLLGADRWNY